MRRASFVVHASPVGSRGEIVSGSTSEHSDDVAEVIIESLARGEGGVCQPLIGKLARQLLRARAALAAFDAHQKETK